MQAKLFEMFTGSGAWVIWLIFATSAVGMGIILERWSVLRAATSIKKDELLNNIQNYIMAGNLEKAIQYCSQVRSPLTNIVRAGIQSCLNGKGAEEVQTAMDAAALREIPKLEKRVNLLAMLSNLATLLGLVGTVTGMIGAFGAVGKLSAAEKASVLASEISHAMHATAFGLIVGVTLLAAFGWLQALSTDAVDDIHEASVSTLNFILSNRKKVSGGN